MHERVYLKVAPHLDARRWVVGLSGGIDSVVLLHTLSQLPSWYPDVQFPPIHAIHINHQLQPDAEHWELFCAEFARRIGVSYQSITVDVASGASLEEQARRARYQAFSQAMTSDDLLMLAHHRDDQAETFLFRLFRGAGVRGLMSIAADTFQGNLHILRPLLEVSKQAIIDYAKQSALSWVEDPSNGSFAFDRNYIRQRVIPVVRERWPAAPKSIERAIQHLVEAESLMDEVAAEDIRKLDHGKEAGEAWLQVDSMYLSAERRKNLLRYFFRCNHVVLSDKQWSVFLEEVVGASRDSTPELIAGDKVIRRYRGRVYICERIVDDWQEIEWDTSKAIFVPGYGRLELTPTSHLTLTLKKRVPGQIVRADRKGAKAKKLKQVLQELSVPPWRREYIPVVYANDIPIAIADLLLLDSAGSVLNDSRIVRTDSK